MHRGNYFVLKLLLDTSDPEVDRSRLPQATQILEELPTRRRQNRYGWRMANSASEAVQFTFDSVYTYDSNNVGPISNDTEQNPENSESNSPNQVVVGTDYENANNEPDGFAREFNVGDRSTIEELEMPQDLQDSTENHCCRRSEDNMDMSTTTRTTTRQKSLEMLKEIKTKEAVDLLHNNITESTTSIRSIGSFVCRICHNDEHPERLVSPCFCKGSLSYVHVSCLEHWISTSRKTVCELCQFRYTTIQTLRYTCLQSLRMWYSNSMSRRALQEDCQMLSLLTLVAFGIIGTMLVGVQYYFAQIRSSTSTITRIWTKGWLLFFLFTTLIVYFINVYVIARGQLSPWYRWWQSAREIKLILENRKTLHPSRKLEKAKATPEATPAASPTTTNFSLQNACRNMPITEAEVPVSRVLLNVIDADDNNGNDGGRRNAMASNPSDETSMMATSDEEHLERQLQQQQHRQQQEQHHNSNPVAVAFFNI